MKSTTATGFRAKTAKEQQLDHKLAALGEEPLETYVRSSRANGDSWVEIAFQLRNLTGIKVPDQALRRWLRSVID